MQDTIARVKKRDKDNNRRGGVIWHTTGSGKSLTMVMISKALALDKEIDNPRVLNVTDRISLDKQIYKTFDNCGKTVKKAKSGSDLIDLLKDRGNEIITTIIDKFNVATSRAKFKDASRNIFLTEYSALEDFDEEDLTNAVSDMTETIRQLPSHHAAVWDIFKTVKNKDDIEALERCIADKDVRDEFYEVLSQFARTLQLCFASDSFYEEYTEQQISFYKSELKKFQSLRVSVQYRYAEKVSYKEYEPRVKKLLNTYVHAENVYEITKDINIFDQNMVQEALANYGTTPASKADFIAHRMKKVITENMEKDEAYYKKFSDMIEDTIIAFQEGRLDEKGYLDRINSIRDDLDKGHQEGIPALVKDKPEARAVFGGITQVLMETHGKQKVSAISEKLAIAGIDITKIIENLTIRDWKKNVDVQNRMENEIEDYLIEHRKDLGVEINFDDIDAILVKCLKVAKNNY